MAKKYTQRDLRAFRDLLLRARGVVSGDLSQLEVEAFGGGAQPAGAGPRRDDTADGYYQDLNLGLLEHDHTTLREIDEAIGRIDEDRFGVCEGCDELIARERLKAVPHARMCIACQRQVEQGGC